MNALGINIGHSYTKAVLNGDGGEQNMETFPSQIAPADVRTNSIAAIDTVVVDHRPYWFGADAEIGGVTTWYGQERLNDPTFIPALAQAIMLRLGVGNVYAFSCLPATWLGRAQMLNDRIREGFPNIVRMGVISEPQAAAYGMLLDHNGNIVGDERLRGRVGVIDIGGGTVDICVLNNLQIEPNSLRTTRKGVINALTEIQGLVAGEYDRDLSIFQTDMAVRARRVVVAGNVEPLPTGWEYPLTSLASGIVSHLDSVWGSAGHLDVILLAGGGACEPLIIDTIRNRYHHCLVVDDPQHSIARGCARRARMLINQENNRRVA